MTTHTTQTDDGGHRYRALLHEMGLADDQLATALEPDEHIHGRQENSTAIRGGE
jgi:hypothetical protein